MVQISHGSVSKEKIELLEHSVGCISKKSFMNSFSLGWVTWFAEKNIYWQKFLSFMNVCPFFMPDFLMKSSGLRWLHRPSSSTPTTLQSMTQTNLTLIGLTAIQSNKGILMWPDLGSAHIQSTRIHTSTHTFKHICSHTHTRLFNHARISPPPPTCTLSVWVHCGKSAFWRRILHHGISQLARPRSPNRVTVVTAVEN